MKTRQPMIVTARIDADDLDPFDTLRRIHFPPERNFLHAHLTIFHRLPGEYVDRIIGVLAEAASGRPSFAAQVESVCHLGAGVAFSIASVELETLRAGLKAEFAGWLGPQDQPAWRPHITIQNRVSKTTADTLHRQLLQTFLPHPIRLTGLDLWRYLDGPWRLEATIPFSEPE